MSIFSTKLKSYKPTQVLLRELRLDELLKVSVLRELKKQLGIDNDIQAVSVSFHITAPDKTNDDVSDREAETMVSAFILEQKGVGRKSIKGPEIAESLCLPADQVERVLDRFVGKKKLSLV